MISAVSILSSVYFFRHEVEFDGAEFDLCASEATFNTEDKKGAVKDFKPYFHKLVKSDEIKIGIVAEPVSDTDYKLQIYNKDGEVVSTQAFTNVTDTLFHEVTANISGLDDYGRYFFVIAKEGSPWNMFAISDVHILYPSANPPNKSELITVSNEGTSIDYENADSDTAFTTRVTAAFHRPNYPEDVESDTLSTGNPVLLSSSVKKQRQLRLLPAPGYLHFKMKVILKAYNITIREDDYKQEEGYELKWIDDDHEFAHGQTFLTELDSTIRNLYKL